MKYITWIVAAYAAMAVGMNVAHSAEFKTYDIKFTDIRVFSDSGNIPGCLVEVNTRKEKSVITGDCVDIAYEVKRTFMKEEPTATVNMTINGKALNQL